MAAGATGAGAKAAPSAKVIRIDDVVKALEIAAERLGDAEQSCATLRAWAAAGRVTPAGQELTPEAIDAGIKRWLSQRDRSSAAVAANVATPQRKFAAVPTTAAAAACQSARQLAVQTPGSSAGPQAKKARRETLAEVSTTASVSLLATCPDSTLASSVVSAASAASVAMSSLPFSDVLGPAAPKVKRRLRKLEVEPAALPVIAPASSSTAPSRSRASQALIQQSAATEATVHTSGNSAVAATLAVVAVATELEGEAAKRLRRSYDEKREARLREEERAKEFARQRFDEVLLEMDSHMEAILERSGPKAMEVWRAAAKNGDLQTICARRELYTRLVHAVRESEVQVPEELNGELLPHQTDGLEWLSSLYTNGLHGILADEMGLGKTIQTISLLLHLRERKGNSGPHLVVAPKSCLNNWEAELKRFAPCYTVHVLTGDLGERGNCMKALQRDVEQGAPLVLVTNYEQVRRNEQVMRSEWQLVIVDEGHRLKNPDTMLHKAMAQLRCRMRLLLTGTPLQNSLGELWALLHYLLPELFTQMMDFKAWFASPFKGVPGLNEFAVQLAPDQEQEVIGRMHALLAPFLLQRLKAEVLADRLPPRTETIVRVPLSAWQRSTYGDLEKRTIKLLSAEDGVNSEQVNNALMQLRKIVLHPYLFQEGYDKGDTNIIRSSGKLEALDRMLTKLLRFNHKVLVFSQFTSMLDILEAYLKWRGFTHVRLDGQVSHELRRERIERFQTDPQVHVFLLSARAGGLGLNLQAADTVILFDMDWNPQNDKQAVARAHRVGQTREVRVIRLLTDSPVEMHMERRCQEKLEMEKKIMGAGMFRRQATAEQRRTALRAMLGLEKDAEDSARTTVPTIDALLTPPEALNRAIARNEGEYEAFQAIDTDFYGLHVKQDRHDPATSRSRLQVELLEACGRLMTQKEVPRGFMVSADVA